MKPESFSVMYVYPLTFYDRTGHINYWLQHIALKYSPVPKGLSLVIDSFILGHYSEMGHFQSSNDQTVASAL